MYFVAKFLEYTAVKGSTNLNKIITLDPRDPQVDVDADITVTFNSAPTGKVFCFIEKLETASTVGDVTGLKYTILFWTHTFIDVRSCLLSPDQEPSGFSI